MFYKVLKSRGLKRTMPIIVALILWTIASQFSTPLFLPQPKQVAETFWDLVQNGVLLDSLAASFFRITVATTIVASISIPIGLLVANYKFIDDSVTPITSFMRFMPVTAFYPLLVMWVGIGETMKISFLVFATIFYFLPTVILSVKDVNVDLIDTARTMGMSKLKVMTRVLLPASLPSILQSFLMMYGIGWTYIIIAEIINTNTGLGYLINIGSARGRTDMVFASLITILIVSFILDTTGNFAIRKLFKWKFLRKSE